jgi:hypothetical protein
MSKSIINPQNIISEISRVGKELSRIYEDFLIEKHDYLNHKKTIEYLFNKPLEKVSSYHDLMYVSYESPARERSVKLVRLELKDKSKINSFWFLMNEFLSDFSEEYNFYEKYIKIYEQKYNKSFNELLKFDYLPVSPIYLPHFVCTFCKTKRNSQKNGKLAKNWVKSKLNIHKKNIMQILNKINNAMNNKFSYVYKWNFKVEGEHTNLMKLPTVNNQQSFVYDFYGITMWYDQLVQFVILFDDDSHFDSSPFCSQKVEEKFDKIHYDDILKQFMLFQMNIHLLRLNERSNLKTEILSFIKRIRIRTSTKYVIEGKIKPIARLFQSKEVIDELALFKEDYEYNHVIFLKIPPIGGIRQRLLVSSAGPIKKNPKYNSDEYFEYQSIKDNYSEVAADSGALVSTDVLKNIIYRPSKPEDKEDFHPLKKETFNEKKANEIIVELMRDNGVESSADEVSDNVLDEKEEADRQ